MTHTADRDMVAMTATGEWGAFAFEPGVTVDLPDSCSTRQTASMVLTQIVVESAEAVEPVAAAAADAAADDAAQDVEVEVDVVAALDDARCEAVAYWIVRFAVGIAAAASEPHR